VKNFFIKGQKYKLKKTKDLSTTIGVRHYDKFAKNSVLSCIGAPEIVSACQANAQFQEDGHLKYYTPYRFEVVK